MTEDRVSYSLLDEHWIPCLLNDGSQREFSVKQLFAEASRVRDIVGELPTQTFAINRLLLAILHQTLGTALSQSRWGELWENGLPVDDIHAYLEVFRDRFDLLHPEHPFYQVADLRTEKNEVKGVAALIFDVPPNFRLFTGRTGNALNDLSFAEAARWLIHVHAYDVSGIHSGMVGDERVKGGKGFGIGTGYTGELGGVLVEGNTLAETLLLNLVPRSERDIPRDVPPWERPQDTAAARTDPTPHATVDLLTWQSRRVRLVHDGSRVTGCLVGNGDKISIQNLYTIEPMTAWRFNKSQTQKNKGMPVYLPRKHQPERAFWRNVTGLTVHRIHNAGASETPPGFPPPVIDWLLELQESGYLSPSLFLAPRAIGVEYGTQNSVVTNIIDDRVMLPLASLDATRYPELNACVHTAITATDSAIYELGKLAGNLTLAAGGDPEGPSKRAREEGFAAVDLPFRRWLRSLDVASTTDFEKTLDEWKNEVKKIVRKLGTDLINTAGDIAWQGRLVSHLNREQFITTSVAENWFTLGLKRALTSLSNDSATVEHPEKEGTGD